MAREMKSFRLTEETAQTIKSGADYLGISQSTFIEYMCMFCTEVGFTEALADTKEFRPLSYKSIYNATRDEEIFNTVKAKFYIENAR